MARIKPKRHGVVTDMTAMCDVTFLLLTFFIMTTQFKKPDVEQIKQLTVNGIEMFIYSSVDGVIVKYVAENISFSMLFNNISIYDVVEIFEKF